MPYTLKRVAMGDGYDFFNGSKHVGSLVFVSNNEALLKLVGRGKAFFPLPEDFNEVVSRGLLSEEYVNMLINSGFSPCDCEICSKPASMCEYKKRMK